MFRHRPIGQALILSQSKLSGSEISHSTAVDSMERICSNDGSASRSRSKKTRKLFGIRVFSTKRCNGASLAAGLGMPNQRTKLAAKLSLEIRFRCDRHQAFDGRQLRFIKPRSSNSLWIVRLCRSILRAQFGVSQSDLWLFDLESKSLRKSASFRSVFEGAGCLNDGEGAMVVSGMIWKTMNK